MGVKTSQTVGEYNKNKGEMVKIRNKNERKMGKTTDQSKLRVFINSANDRFGPFCRP